MKAGVRTLVALLQMVAFRRYDATGLGLSRLDAAVSTRAPEAGGKLATVKEKSDNLPASPASESPVASQLASGS